MKIRMHLIAVVLAFVAPLNVAAGRNKVRLLDVSTLTLSASKQNQLNEYQLQCISGCAATGVAGTHVNQAQCKNGGMDDMGDVQWECDALMPKGCRFVTTEVKCKMVDDEYIVPGSCFLTYSLECDRASDSAAEETVLRKSIVLQKTKMKRATKIETDRIRQQANEDACELAVAAARYQVGGDAVEVNFGQSTGWVKGRVTMVDCTGKYAVYFTGRSLETGVDESRVRLYQKPITKTEDIYEDVHYYNDHNARHANSNHRQQQQHQQQDVNLDDLDPTTVLGIIVVLVVVVVLLMLTSKQRITESAVVDLFMSTAGYRLPLSAVHQHFARALDNEKNSGGHAKLEAILRGNCDLAQVQGQGEVLLLKQHVVVQEVSRRQEQEARMRDAAAQARNGRGSGAGAGRRGGDGNAGFGNGGTTTVRQRVGTRVLADTVSTEQARAAREKVLAAQAALRVAAVKAKQDRAESARVQEFQTKMDQLQRELMGDTAQLGNAMARYDRVMEQYKATGYATTGSSF